MNKLLTIFISLFTAISLIGCNSSDSNEQTNLQEDHIQDEEIITQEEDEPNDGDVTEEDTTTAEDGDDTVIEDEAEEKSNVTSTVNNDHLKDLAEYDMLSQHLDLDHYKGVIKTDNQGNRIILFETEDGHKEYKSIFIKHKNRLKIVHFDNEDNLLYNGIIN